MHGVLTLVVSFGRTLRFALAHPELARANKKLFPEIVRKWLGKGLLLGAQASYKGTHFHLTVCRPSHSGE